MPQILAYTIYNHIYMQQNQILENLKVKVEELQKSQEESRRLKNQAQQQLDRLKSSNHNLTNQIEIQKKKYLALNVFVAQLQRKYDTNFTDVKNFNTDTGVLQSQKVFLKQILIKKGEQVEHYKTTNDFLRNIIQRKGKIPPNSKFIEQQLQLISKLNKKLHEYKNQDFLCTRKWTNLERQNFELQNRFKSLSIQLERQNAVLQESYEAYIDKINKYNTKMAYLNGVNDQKIISEHLIQQMSFLQEERKQIQQAGEELTNQYQLMKDDYQNLNRQNYSIKEFFQQKNQHTKVANKMRLRIEELNDLLRDYKMSVSSARLLNLSKTMTYVAEYQKKLKQANKHLTHRLEQSIKGNACIDQILAGKFFSKLLEDKDEKIICLRKTNSEMLKRLQELQNESETLHNHYAKVKQQVDLNSLENQVNQQDLRKKILSQYTFKR